MGLRLSQGIKIPASVPVLPVEKLMDSGDVSDSFAPLTIELAFQLESARDMIPPDIWTWSVFGDIRKKRERSPRQVVVGGTIFQDEIAGA